MSNQEPDGTVRLMKRSGHTLDNVHRECPDCRGDCCDFVGYLISPQELSRLRAIDEWAEWAARELREVYSSTDKPHILKAYDALTEAKP